MREYNHLSFLRIIGVLSHLSTSFSRQPNFMDIRCKKDENLIWYPLVLWINVKYIIQNGIIVAIWNPFHAFAFIEGWIEHTGEQRIFIAYNWIVLVSNLIISLHWDIDVIKFAKGNNKPSYDDQDEHCQRQINKFSSDDDDEDRCVWACSFKVKTYG